MAVPDFVVSSLDFSEPQRLSAGEILDHLSVPGNWHEASIGPRYREYKFLAAYPFMNIEFHGRAGFSLLLFSDVQAIGVMASMQSELSAPSVYVCLGGQVIEKWPKELFLSRLAAEKTIGQFLSQAAPEPSTSWIRLDRFPRETVHSGGKGLITLWNKLSVQPQFPFEPATGTA